jgi:hypothetical protein
MNEKNCYNPLFRATNVNEFHTKQEKSEKKTKMAGAT